MTALETPPDENSSGPLGPERWGTPTEFTAFYEDYLDTVYRDTGATNSTVTGRQRLAESIINEMRERDVKTVLDCGAGTGFPALDIAAVAPGKNFVIHCTDSDKPMLDILAEKVRDTYGPEHGVTLESLAPNIRFKPRLSIGERMQLDWAQLDQVEGHYDYVMCRGNSLVYATTWAGGDDVASLDEVKELLHQIARRVKRGGYLHVDAPRSLKNRETEYTQKTSRDGRTTVWEEVSTETDYRRWRLSFKSPSGLTKFKRFSTLMTIDDVSMALKEMGFTNTDPMELKHERPGFGVIIAKKRC
jgi:SAM-dependent methyltransferase